ncbi:MAG: TolC family protein [Bacteroidales bacterium]|nr:TolC family protein [Bacteroidales bacterium]
MKKIVFTIECCFLLFISTTLLSQEANTNLKELSFEDALQITEQNSLILKQAQQNIDQKEQEQKATLGLYMPKVSLNAQYVYMSEDINLDLTPVKDAITPIYGALGNYGVFSDVPNPDPNTSGVMPYLPDDIATAAVRQELLNGLNEINSKDWNQIIQKKQFGVVSAGFTMPLYTGGKIRTANKAAKIKVEEAQVESKQKLDELTCELIGRYYGLALANNAQKIREEVLRTMQDHLGDAEKLMNEGLIAKAEYLHAKVYHSSADRELKKVKRQVNIVNDALLNTLAVKESTTIYPISNLFYTKEIESIDFYWEKANQNSSLLKQIDTKKQLAEQGYKIEKAGFFPTIAAMGTYDLYNKDLSPNIPEYMVGVGMKWNLFTGTERLKKLKASKIQQMQVETFYQKAESDIKTAITKYYQEIQMNLEQLEELESALEFATEYYRVRESAFKEGMATTTEVSDASLAVAKVKIERLEVMYSFDISLSNLLYYSGLSSEFSSYMSNPNTIYESY